MKKTVCIDARMACRSGIGRYIRFLVPQLSEKYSLKLIVNRGGAGCIEFEGCDLVFSNAPIYSIREQVELPYLIPKCDLFWSPHFNIPLLPCRAKKRLVTIHDVLFLAHPEHFGLHKRAYAKVFFNRAATLSDHVITISEFSHREINSYIGVLGDKITPIPLAVSSDRFQGLEEKGNLKVPLKFILYVGNFARHKNILRLIQSLDFLEKDVHLVLAGKQTGWNEWKVAFEKRKDRVTLCGNVEDGELTWLYQNAAALVHPSWYEGFGITPLEAMSAGCPVVAARAASLPEVCGDAAEYVDPYCEKDIARGVRAVLDGKRAGELREKGYAQVKRFNLQTCAQKHMEVIDQLIGKG